MDAARDVSADLQMQRSDFDRTKMQNVPTDVSTSDLQSFSPDYAQQPSQSLPLYHITWSAEFVDVKNGQN